MKGIIYVRVSSGEQVQGTSLEFQTEQCTKYCNEKGIEIVQILLKRENLPRQQKEHSS
jgi:DNA invertase Pin-like site-specific DNA recombinase